MEKQGFSLPNYSNALSCDDILIYFCILQFVVGCYVYVKATATVFPNTIIALSSCWATPTPDCNDATKYYLADSGCDFPDSTFEPVDPQADICYKFKFKMFEFWEGFGKLVSNIKSKESYL